VLCFKEIGTVERMIVTEAVYVGHLEKEGKVELIIKRMNEAKVSLDTF
jgi:hypothetical protein